MPIPPNKVQRIFPIRIVLFVGGLVLTIFVLNMIVQGVQTLSRLKVVERERDSWQRPSAVLETLNIKAGNIVVDLGSGSGYFSLKLSSIVGRRGQVLAVDIRRLPLFFLWVRAVMHGMYNIKVIQGDVDHPHLPAGTADAVLVANTYHELSNPRPILKDLFRSLRSGGRLVILDRGPHSANGESDDLGLQHHEIPAVLVEEEIRRAGFEVISREDRFIDNIGDQPWWLLVARKP